MRLVYLFPNAAWIFAFGDDLTPVRLADEALFFRTLDEAKEAATRRGLQVEAKRGRVCAVVVAERAVA